MQTDMVLYNARDGRNLATVIYNGKEVWIAGQVAEMAGVSDPTSTIAHYLKGSDLEDGVDFDVLKGSSLTYFKSLIETVGYFATEESSVAKIPGPAYGFIGKICAELDLSQDEVIRCEDKTAQGKTISVTNYFPSVIPKVEDWLDKHTPVQVTRKGKVSYAYTFTNSPASYVEFKK